MNRKRAYIFFSTFMTLVCLYAGFCLRPYYTNAEIEIQDPIPPEAEAAIRQWHDETTEIPMPTMTARGIWYALTHPYMPSVERCLVSQTTEELILIHTSFDIVFTAIFIIDDGRWIYDREGSHNSMDQFERQFE